MDLEQQELWIETKNSKKLKSDHPNEDIKCLFNMTVTKKNIKELKASLSQVMNTNKQLCESQMGKPPSKK